MAGTESVVVGGPGAAGDCGSTPAIEEESDRLMPTLGRAVTADPSGRCAVRTVPSGRAVTATPRTATWPSPACHGEP
jgi:hypothetical protein